MYYFTLNRQNTYSRRDAVNYALTYALNPNPEYMFLSSHDDEGGDCSNFVSQCLRAGGANFVSDSSRPWWYKKSTSKGGRDTWSLSWAVAHSLYWFLKIRGINNMPGIKGIEILDIDFLELGDIIQYENKDNIIYHSAIITDFVIEKGIKSPLVSQHSFNGVNVFYKKDAARKMHLMKIII